jgi:hypothetical protein
LPFSKGKYKIEYLEDDYEGVVVGSPSKNFMWIMTREEKRDEKLIKKLEKKAVNKGYNKEDFENVFQGKWQLNAWMDKSTVPIVDYPDDYGYKTKKYEVTPDEFIDLAKLTSTNYKSKLMDRKDYEELIRSDKSVKNAKKGLKSKKKVVPMPTMKNMIPKESRD